MKRKNCHFNSCHFLTFDVLVQVFSLSALNELVLFFKNTDKS